MKGKWHERRDTHGQVRKVLALCDTELLGKVFREGDAVLDLKTYRGFYEGQSVTQEQAESWLKEARNINIVGPRSVECAKKAFSINDAAIKVFGKVPHLQVYYV